MIELQKYTPEVYYNQSRDFQFIGRLYDILFNAVKMRSAQLYNLPINEDSDEALIDLVATTLGFQTRHDYNVQQLKMICSIFSEVLRNKGNMKAVELAGKALLKAEGITEEFSCEFVDNTLQIFISQELSDTSLIRDLMTYLLPAGTSCEIIRTLQLKNESETMVYLNDNVKSTIQKTNDIMTPEELDAWKADAANKDKADYADPTWFMNNTIANNDADK